jgi:hypothetical protein
VWDLRPERQRLLGKKFSKNRKKTSKKSPTVPGTTAITPNNQLIKNSPKSSFGGGPKNAKNDDLWVIPKITILSMNSVEEMDDFHLFFFRFSG